VRQYEYQAVHPNARHPLQNDRPSLAGANPPAGRTGAKGEEVRRLMLSEVAYWLMGAGAMLVVLGIVAFAFSEDPA
jgi:hypothetical protein